MGRRVLFRSSLKILVGFDSRRQCIVTLDEAPVALCGPAGRGEEGGLSSLLWEEEDSYLALRF